MIISLRTTQFDALRTSIYATNAAMGEAAADEARDIIAAAIKTNGRASIWRRQLAATSESHSAQHNIDSLRTSIYATNAAMGEAAADEARDIIAAAIKAKGRANVILATGNSQLTFLTALRTLPGIDWKAVNVFHMDEYVGIDPTHPASFPLFLRTHILDAVKPGMFYPVPSQAAYAELACRDYEALLRAHPADLCAMGIGENGHIAFNDPPFADFDDPVWVKVVKLDERSRRQQVGEGHFKSLAEVPTHAITLDHPGAALRQTHPVHRAGSAQSRGGRTLAARPDHRGLPGLDPAPGEPRAPAAGRGVRGTAELVGLISHGSGPARSGWTS